MARMLICLTLVGVISRASSHSTLAPGQSTAARMSVGLPSVVSVEKQREVDLVLDCTYLEEKAGQWGAFASGFTHDPATLVLRDVRVTDEESLDAYTKFEPKDTDENAIIFEAKGTSMEPPEAEIVLHADCNDKEVTCEISRYFAPSKKDKMERGQEGEVLGKEEAGPENEDLVLDNEKSEPEVVELQQNEIAQGASWFIFYVLIPDSNFSISIVMKTETPTNWSEEGGEHKLHPRLKMPLSDMGTIPVTVDLSVFTRSPSIVAALRSVVTLHCGLISSSLDTAAVEWRVQQQGSGHTVFQYSPGQDEGAWPARTQMEPQRLRDQGDASLTITDVWVQDEGTYICLISTPQSHAQQIIRVLVQEPPKVILSVLPQPQAVIPKTVVMCDMAGYFPLDVQVHWTRSRPEAELEDGVAVSESYSSSHRLNQDGTFSISSSIEVKTAGREKEGVTYTCTVSHVSLQEPIRASALLDPVGSGILLGFVIGFLVFLLVCGISYLIFKHRKKVCPAVKDTEEQKLKLN